MTEHYWWCTEGDDCECDPDVTEEEAAMAEPCQPIGCDNGYHLQGCVYFEETE